MKIESKTKDKVDVLFLTDVWYVPNISRNLFSVLAAQDKLGNSKFISAKILVVQDEVIISGSRSVGESFYKANIKVVIPNVIEEVNTI